MSEAAGKGQDNGFLTTMVEKASNHGDIAFGVLLASLTNYFFVRLASSEQRKHIRLIQEREKHLDEQLRVKEERIGKLHEMLEKKEK